MLRVAGTERRGQDDEDRKSTRLNSSHSQISYAVFCLKKKTPPSFSDDDRTNMSPCLKLIDFIITIHASSKSIRASSFCASSMTARSQSRSILPPSTLA